MHHVVVLVVRITETENKISPGPNLRRRKLITLDELDEAALNELLNSGYRIITVNNGAPDILIYHLTNKG